MTLIRCRECGREVSDAAAKCPHCGAPIKDGGQVKGRELMPESNLIWGVVTTVCCCLPFGIASIIQASKVSNYWDGGQYEMAYEAAAKAKKYAIIGAVIAGVGIAAYLIFLFVFIYVMNKH
ncbi:MAG: CD225/dispanin family protein [Bacteroidales bacterium]|nr:CD225/dispanin family protein [Bacteroidales bacterium]